MFACPLAYLKNHAQISEKKLFMINVVVALSFSDDNAIRYVLPVVRMTSFFRIMAGAHEAESKIKLCFVWFAWWRHRGEV